MTDIEQLERRNAIIKRIVALFGCSYATAAQFYSGLHNYKKG